jgi:flagellar hook-associated protein 3 FlgL
MATVTRVSNQQITSEFINQIFKQRQDLETSRSQVASGVRVALPSDDPGRSATISELQLSVQRFGKHEQRISQAENFLSFQDSAMGQVDEIMVRAKELATQAANETNSSEVRKNIAEEVYGLRDALVSLANSKFQGVYIYGGAADNVPPFDSNTGAGGYTFPADPLAKANKLTSFSAADGSSVTRNVQISDFESLKVNTPGDQVFLRSIVAVESLARSLDGYKTNLVDRGDGIMIPDQSGDAYNFPTEYDTQTSDIIALIDNIETARVNDISVERSSIGSRINALDRSKEILTTLKLNAEKSRASIQDVDIFEAASNLSNLQLGLQALLSSGAQINNLSLLNFI